MTDSKLIDTLNMASSLDLFRLRSGIDRMLDDPKRIVPIRAQLHIGQSVRFFDGQRGEMRSGRITAMRDRQIVVHEDGTRLEWKPPYAAVEPPTRGTAGSAGVTSAETAPPPPKPRRDDFRPGEKVSFDDRYLQAHVGTIVRINQRTATVDCDGQTWRVSFGALRHLVDL
jgi:hypothetical protein